MANRQFVLIIATLSVTLTYQGADVEACGGDGGYLTALFWYDARPSTGDEAFVKGDLGIIGPSLPASRLWIAYRYLAGLSMSEDEQRAALTAIKPDSRAPRAEDGTHSWVEARRKVPGAEKVEYVWTLRDRTVTHGEYEIREDYRNCLNDGFRVATETLDERIEEFGAGSEVVREWLRGQDTVFSNCYDGFQLPPDLDASWPDILRADRSYQRASAFFYAEHYEEAEEAYRQIAHDPTSQWAATARYMVARVMARDGRFIDAISWLRDFSADPGSGAWRDRSLQLINHYQFRLDPLKRLVEVDGTLSGTSLPSDITQSVTDWIWCLERNRKVRSGPRTWSPRDSLPPNIKLTTWFWLWRFWGSPKFEEPEATAAASDRPWLIAKLRRTSGLADSRSEAKLYRADTLIDLAKGVQESEPGYLTARYHRARILIGLYRLSTARSELDALLSTEGLSLSDENRLRDLRSQTASTVTEFIEDTMLAPLETGYPRGKRNPLSPVSRRDRIPDNRLPTWNAIDFFNRVSPNDLLEIERTDDLPASFRIRMVHTAWTRAVVLKHFDVARAASSRAAELSSNLSHGLRLPDNDKAAGFDAELTLLRYPQLSPLIVGVFDHQQSRYAYQAASKRLESHITVAPIVAELSDEESIAAMIRGFDIGLETLEWAEHHRNDPRVPEALHRLVQSKRASGDISQAAFQLLHRRYPDSPWAEKTPYWYK